MTAARNQTTPDRTREILEDLEAVRENLLALSDDIWLSIDHNDPQALDEGVAFKKAYNEKVAAFDRLAGDLSVMVQQFTRVRLESTEQTSADDDREANARLVRELDRDEPHSIDEDFTYRRPHGYILDGQAAAGITTWRRLYELVCLELLKRDPERFRSLPENPRFISRRGNRQFAFDPGELRSAAPLGDGLHTEINLSANALRDVLRDLLDEFNIPRGDLRIYMRQDRDAQRVRAN
jgi:hypothetical protein